MGVWLLAMEGASHIRTSKGPYSHHLPNRQLLTNGVEVTWTRWNRSLLQAC